MRLISSSKDFDDINLLHAGDSSQVHGNDPEKKRRSGPPQRWGTSKGAATISLPRSILGALLPFVADLYLHCQPRTRHRAVLSLILFIIVHELIEYPFVRRIIALVDCWWIVLLSQRGGEK
jgi:hypothetical protein